MLSFTFFQVIPAFYLVALVTSTSQILSNLSSPPGPVVNLGYAAFVGNTTAPSGELNGPVSFFGGIPYAQPPVGDLRFRAPRMLDETFTNGTMMVTDARNWGAPCIQQPAQVGVGNEGTRRITITSCGILSESARVRLRDELMRTCCRLFDIRHLGAN